jgi:tetratricopeptide (TPR) repeat protein
MKSFETENRQVFELVADAAGAIKTSNLTHERHGLARAREGLKKAAQLDPDYLFAPYYEAVIEDLLGNHAQAVRLLLPQLQAAPQDRPGLVNEMRYNLAVAQFHRYGQANLNEAAQTLQAILAATADKMRWFKTCWLRLHAQVLHARVQAMLCIPEMPEMAGEAEEKARIKDCYDEARKQANTVLASWRLWFLCLLHNGRAREIRANAFNALAAAEMYFTDCHLDTDKKRRKALTRGLGRLNKADRLFPDDWAIQCNIASCRMRLGYWGGDACEYDQAIKILTKVVAELYPGYGFALYELGRCCRLKGDRNKALYYFAQALKVAEDTRAVSDKRLAREVELALVPDRHYP